MCFAACTKDNSSQTPAVKITPKNSVSFAKKDTITPQVKKASPLVAGKDTITPKSVSFSLRDTITPQIKFKKSAVAQKDTITPQK